MKTEEELIWEAYNFKKVIDNPNFKKWFGDSKVVDEQGNPLIVYHGTNLKFDEFKPSRLQGNNFFFTDLETAANYGNNTISVYLSLKKPLFVSESIDFSDSLHDPKVKEKYDGIIYNGITELGNIINGYVAFSTTQIKSIYNNGEFDPNNPNINK